MAKWEKIDPADIKVGDRIKKVWENLPTGYWIVGTVTGFDDGGILGGNYKLGPSLHEGQPFGIRGIGTFYRKVPKVKPITEYTVEWTLLDADNHGATLHARLENSVYEFKVVVP